MTEAEFKKRVAEEIGEMPSIVEGEEQALDRLFDWNSMNLLLVTSLILEEFGVRLSNKEVLSCQTLADLYKLSTEKQAD